MSGVRTANGRVGYDPSAGASEKIGVRAAKRLIRRYCCTTCSSSRSMVRTQLRAAASVWALAHVAPFAEIDESRPSAASAASHDDRRGLGRDVVRRRVVADVRRGLRDQRQVAVPPVLADEADAVARVVRAAEAVQVHDRLALARC